METSRENEEIQFSVMRERRKLIFKEKSGLYEQVGKTRVPRCSLHTKVSHTARGLLRNFGVCTFYCSTNKK